MNGEWISVDDQLPNLENEHDFWSEDVLAFSKESGICVAYCNEKGDKWLSEPEEKQVRGVTHWMPLPADPEVDA